MTGTCPHRRVHGSSPHVTWFHIATSTSGQRGGPWRRRLDQRWVTRHCSSRLARRFDSSGTRWPAPHRALWL